MGACIQQPRILWMHKSQIYTGAQWCCLLHRFSRTMASWSSQLDFCVSHLECRNGETLPAKPSLPWPADSDCKKWRHVKGKDRSASQFCQALDRHCQWKQSGIHVIQYHYHILLYSYMHKWFISLCWLWLRHLQLCLLATASNEKKTNIDIYIDDRHW